MLSLIDNLMDNSNMATLHMKHRNWITILHNNYVSPLIQSTVDIFLDSRNAATTSKPNVALVTIVLK